MSYHVYHTEAIILGGRPHGEGDRILYCYTRDLGLVYAHAKSVSEGRSRLRYALQTFSHATVDLIRGKHGWKLVSARPISSFASLWRDPEKRIILAQHAHLFRRMIQGEEEHSVLFSELLAAFTFLERVEGPDDLRAAELVFVVRVLSRLGYWGGGEVGDELLCEHPWTDTVLRIAQRERSRLLVGVNHALAASHL